MYNCIRHTRHAFQVLPPCRFALASFRDIGVQCNQNPLRPKPQPSAPLGQRVLLSPPDNPASGFREVLNTFRGWWGHDVTGTVDQIAVIEKRRSECQLSARYLLMVSMSAGIAILGLLLSSPAVVIGAMLLSPLMDPIMGVGFALATGDFKWLRQSGKSLAVGTLAAIVFCALIVMISPLQTVTSEIAARTRPNLFDLAVAFFSAVAGAYAMIRGREGTIVGVAIATALMPPLAVVGFGLATMNGTVFWGSLFLFVTNLTAIALTATAMARLYGFSTSLSEKQTRWQAILIFAAFVALAIPLFLSLRQIVWETQATRQANNVVMEVFGGTRYSLAAGAQLRNRSHPGDRHRADARNHRRCRKPGPNPDEPGVEAPRRSLAHPAARGHQRAGRRGSATGAGPRAGARRAGAGGEYRRSPVAAGRRAGRGSDGGS